MLAIPESRLWKPTHNSVAVRWCRTSQARKADGRAKNLGAGVRPRARPRVLRAFAAPVRAPAPSGFAFTAVTRSASTPATARARDRWTRTRAAGAGGRADPRRDRP